MKIKEIKAKSIITKSGLPGSDYVINPYIGCMHGCIYCYAVFMKRFTNHKEPWGKFLDVKINAVDLIPENTNKYRGKSITTSSVTDCYQPIERKYRLMRGILKKLVLLKPKLCIITKSDLIVRDIDLLKQFKNCSVGVSLSGLDDNMRKDVEPLGCSTERRLNAVKKLKKAGLHTFVFISPIFPELTDWKSIINKSYKFVDEFWFENLNVRATNWPKIRAWLGKKHSSLLGKYRDIYFGKDSYWRDVEKEIRKFCKAKKLDFSIYFHHKRKD